MQRAGGDEHEEMAENRGTNQKVELPSSNPIHEECFVAPLPLQAQSESLRETRAFHHDENTKSGDKDEENGKKVVASKATKIEQPVDIDEDTERESILPTLTHTTNRRPSSFELYKDSFVLFWTEALASEAENMDLPVPNFSHPIASSNSPPPQLPTPDLSPPYPPPVHFSDLSDTANPHPGHLQHPLHRSAATLSRNLETDLHSIYDLYSTCASKPTKPYIAHFPPPPASAFSVPSPLQSHLNSTAPKPKERRTNWALEEHFPFTPLQRMKRKHRKRLYGALFAIFFVSTLGVGVGFLIHGVGDRKPVSASDKGGASPEYPSAGNPSGSETSAGASGGKKEHMMWLVITGGVLVGCHAIFAAVMFVLYGPCGMRRKNYVRDGRGGAVEVPRRRVS